MGLNTSVERGTLKISFSRLMGHLGQEAGHIHV